MAGKRTAKDAGLDSGDKAVKKIHPFFTKDSNEFKEPEQTGTFKWLKPLGPKSTCLHGVNLEPPSRTKVALFDLDGTIIKSSFGSKDGSWEWWRLDVPAKLKRLHEDGYSIVIISNQALKSAALKTWKDKVPSIAASVSPGYLQRVKHKTSSFFVGDAAGRQYPNGKCDFSGTDRKWAMNIGLTFHTPEEYFLGLAVHTNIKLDGFNVATLPLELPLYTPTNSPLLPKPGVLEIVLFVCFPSLGKTSFYGRYFKPANYVHVNQDILGSRPKCIKAVEEALDQGLPCVIDNTNRDANTRKYYVDLARRRKVPIRCFHFTGSMELAWHNNLYRALNTPPSVAAKETKRELVPYLAYTSYKNAFQEPEPTEGFSEIKKVNWVFEGNEEARRHWSMWLQLEGK
ncbi:DNA kinase/phosphatase Pnk1 [Marasmius crinis-equi]|uniref:DNA kinase/phosphatase Pnk1 n=1 Tax=Marasmius crinis-equi TaxID=585013 RepID=A0ABR3FSQ7_9AGAR